MAPCRRRQSGGRVARGVALAGAAVMLLGACGAPDGAISEPVVLRVALADDWARLDAVIEAVRTFERDNPGTQVNLRGLPFSQIPDTVRASAEAGEAVDVAQWHAFAAGAQELAEPLDDLWAQHLTADEWLPGALDDVTWQGVRYGVPLDTNALLLLANPALLEERGVDLPAAGTTFADIERLTRAVTSDDGSVRGLALPASTWVAYGWARANGGELVDVDGGEARVTLDAPEVVQALGFLGRLVREELVFPPPGRNVASEAFALFQAGHTALHLTGTWDILALSGRDLGWQPAVRPLPRGDPSTPRGTVLGGSSLYVPRGAPNHELAFQFMLQLTSDRMVQRYALEDGRLPARPRTFEAVASRRPEFRQALKLLHSASVMRLIAFPRAQAAFTKAVEDIFTGRVEARTALAEAQRIATGVGGAP